MRTPPALRLELKASLFYRCLSIFITLILIAACAYSAVDFRAFHLQKQLFFSVFCGFSTLISLWMLYAAFKTPMGSLQYRDGAWILQLENTEIEGTLEASLDLQVFLLLEFVALNNNSIKYPKWIPLEAGQMGSADWLALRRAVFAPHRSISDPLRHEKHAL